MGIRSSKAVCLELASSWFRGDGSLLPLPHRIKSQPFFLPSCLPSMPYVRANPLSLWDRAPSAKLLITALVVFVDCCQILLHRSPPPSGRAAGVRGRRHPSDAARADPHSCCLGRAPGCLPVSRALDVMQGQLGLLSGF